MPISEGPWNAQSQKRWANRMREKKAENDSDEWVSIIQIMGSDLMFRSWEWEHMLTCLVVGARDTMVCRSWRTSGRSGWSDDSGHASDIQRSFSDFGESKPSEYRERVKTSSESGPDEVFSALSWIDWRCSLELASSKVSDVFDWPHSSEFGSSHIHGHISIFFTWSHCQGC